ncbi:MAG TPA: hypothetical protein VJQ78_16960 [Sphingobium sp.]|nr:hypothetical protein [Sphingobium sp.]
MNPFEMVVAIVAIAAIASIVRAKYGIVRRHRGEELIPRGPDPEAERLRAELKALKDRVAVLERLATDSSAALDREFDKLRERD